MRLTRNQVLEIYRSLEILISHITQKNIKLCYELAKCKSSLKSEIEAIKIIQQPSKNFIKYEKEREKIAQKYAAKNETEFIIIQSSSGPQYKIENMEKFGKEIENLQKEYKEDLEEHIKHIEEIYNFLKENVEVNISQIPHSLLFIDGTFSNETLDLVQVLEPLINTVFTEDQNV